MGIPVGFQSNVFHSQVVSIFSYSSKGLNGKSYVLKMEIVESSSPVSRVDRNSPQATIDQIRLEHKKRYAESLREEISITRGRIDHLRKEIKAKAEI